MRYSLAFKFSRIASLMSALSKEMPIKAITKENGKAPMIIAVLMADKPPARSKTAITSVNAAPHVMIWTLPFCEASPPGGNRINDQNSRVRRCNEKGQ